LVSVAQNAHMSHVLHEEPEKLNATTRKAIRHLPAKALIL